MNTKQFDAWVEKLAESPIPDCPDYIENNVLRKIRMMEAEQMKFFPWLSSHIKQLKFLVPALGLAAASSALVTVVSVNVGDVTTHENAVRSLGFESIVQSSTFKWDH